MGPPGRGPRDLARHRLPLAVRTATPADWPALTAAGLPTVRDAGFTEIAPGSSTVVADHPALRGR
ncbi:hypothetical protein SHKM778_29080 [Streptomyces sp. KM77-8]|uniref:GNAT family N-acetyltransferase n=1 Tax=Streptomyces haneummycinicus TaxID=3074435 RepID=A0AAT9HGI0_9ACTN